MNGRQLGTMVLLVFGFLLLWAAMRMGYVLARPTIAKASPQVAQSMDFVLM